MKIFGYGEDSYTYWALTNRLREILDQLSDDSQLSDCLIYYRPSFGRKGGDNRSEFGEFDFIVASPTTLYLGESKQTGSRDLKSPSGLQEVQKKRHLVFRTIYRQYIRASRSANSNFDTFWESFGGAIEVGINKKKVPPPDSKLRENLETILPRLAEKTADSQFAISISIMLNSPYSDEVHYNPDRTWWIHYSPKSGGMKHAANLSLLQCHAQQQPLLVLRQVYDKTHKLRSRYRLMGLGRVQNFNASSNLFHIRGLSIQETESLLGQAIGDDLIETAIRLESLEEWSPFAAEDRAVYRVSAHKRDQKFKEIVVSNYDSQCAVTGLQFRSPKHTEAWGAHIIPKNRSGTDDPRNGLALSQSVHWAFDRGIFRITDQYEIEINSKAKSARINNFPLFQMDRKPIKLPQDKYYWPHQEALAWHKSEIFDKFEL